jgi:hypothetical protein
MYAETATALAHAYLAGSWSEAAMLRRAGEALAPPRPWLRGLTREALAAYPRPPSDRPRELAAYLEAGLIERHPPVPRVRRWFQYDAGMGRTPWPVPALPAPGDLAAWLEIEPPALDWLADVRGLERATTAQRLRNYRYAWIPRNTSPPTHARLLEAPKPRLKALQRRVLREILSVVPVHDAAHGFVPGRSARSHAAAHTGQRVLLRLDLEDFFASVTAGRVFGTFRTAGYPEAVAHALTGLCTNVVPLSIGEQAGTHRLRRRLATPHLPQGAPTSPALANLAAHGLDRRIAALAGSFGATYTRYADDLVISGDHGVARLRAPVAEIARDEGFRLNAAKSRLMTAAGRQATCGIVVNRRPNVPRDEFDRLRATLHNAALDGPGALTRAQLEGRVAWVEFLNPARGARLRERLERIDFSRSAPPGPADSRGSA